MWEYQMPHLAAHGLRAVAYDRRGFGRSSQPGRGYDFDTLADDLAAVLRHLDLRDVTLVGSSMGGGEVARYLSRHGSSRVARTVLIGAVTPFVLRTADNPAGVDPAIFEMMALGLAEDRPQFFTDGVPGLVGGPGGASPAMLQWLVSLALQASPHATIATLRAFAGTDFRADMPAFSVPTLVIHGDADQSTPIDACGRATARAIAGSRLVEYTGAPHGLFLTEKHRLNADLLAFIRG
jgi:pimeloyl-ACP methyl ester carboxylesterase